MKKKYYEYEPDPRKERLDNIMNTIKDNVALSSKILYTPTPTLIEKLATEFDINQRLFLHGKLHSTQFNKWFLTVAVPTLQQATREEVIGEVREWAKKHDELEHESDSAETHYQSYVLGCQRTINYLKTYLSTLSHPTK
jgi:hypothetical protein